MLYVYQNLKYRCILNSQKWLTFFDLILVDLLQLSCKMEHEFRASELAEMMPSQHAVQLAIKYASRLRMLQLAQRLNEVSVILLSNFNIL